ncbi:unnamed protein product [Cuscuta epithymum]|uniref:Uncharacterized protein n=1 Tax=Cuscuta epithymum TaxID=186058 RepID=A0AAV0FFD2_9ASTE|nr:unnamed protein product [Cuscuta epithymum]
MIYRKPSKAKGLEAKARGRTSFMPEAEDLKKTIKGKGLGDEHLSPRMPRARGRSSIVQWPRPGDEHPPPQKPRIYRKPSKAKGLEAKAQGRTSFTPEAEGRETSFSTLEAEGFETRNTS